MTLTTSPAVDLDVRPLAGRIGAEISGVDLAAGPSDSAISAIRGALLVHKVVFFRDQPNLTPAGHLAFAARLGPLTIAHPTVGSIEGEPSVFELDSESGGRANNWHTDVTFVDRPATISILRGVQFPPYGGDTIWANTAAAYDDLPDHLRVLADRLRAVHTNAYDYARAKQPVESGAAEKRREQFVSTVFETEHPVVRVHPETGERSLLLGGFARHIVGLSSSESHDLIRAFQHHVTRPENTVRWQWRAGDVAVWDNRATQHYAVADYGAARRVVQRVTVAGSIPVGIDGRPSRSLKGDADAFSPVGPV